jgi:hypothetical protein
VNGRDAATADLNPEIERVCGLGGFPGANGEARRRTGLGWSLLLAATLAWTAPGWAEEAPAVDEATEERSHGPAIVVPNSATTREPRGKSDPGLDALLHLPSGFLGAGSRSVAGAGEAEWRRRFDRAQSDIDETAENLTQTKKELDSAAEGSGASQWSVAPPGGGSSGGPSGSPLSFKLRQKLKEDRQALENADRAMRELRIEADLAGVPADWRGEVRPSRPRSISE